MKIEGAQREQVRQLEVHASKRPRIRRGFPADPESSYQEPCKAASECDCLVSQDYDQIVGLIDRNL